MRGRQGERSSTLPMVATLNWDADEFHYCWELDGARGESSVNSEFKDGTVVLAGIYHREGRSISEDVLQLLERCGATQVRNLRQGLCYAFIGVKRSGAEKRMLAEALQPHACHVEACVRRAMPKAVLGCHRDALRQGLVHHLDLRNRFPGITASFLMGAVGKEKRLPAGATSVVSGGERMGFLSDGGPGACASHEPSWKKWGPAIRSISSASHMAEVLAPRSFGAPPRCLWFE